MFSRGEAVEVGGGGGVTVLVRTAGIQPQTFSKSWSSRVGDGWWNNQYNYMKFILSFIVDNLAISIRYAHAHDGECGQPC